MPLGRGERIGDAYVRIQGDGTGMAKDIEKDLDRVDGRKAGKKLAQDHGDGFEREWKRLAPTILDDKALESLTGGQQKYSRIGRVNSSSYFDEFEKTLVKRGIGAEIADRIRRDFQYEFTRTGKGIEFDTDGNLLGMNTNFLRELPTLVHDTLLEVAREEDAYYADMDKARQENARRDQMARDEDFERFASDLHARASLMDQALAEDKRRDDERHRSLLDQRHDRDEEFDRNHRRLAREAADADDYAQRFDRIGNKVGGLFGKGSRNNFLNFTGSLLANITRVGLKTVDFFRNFAENAEKFATKIATRFTDAGGGVSGLVAAIGPLLTSAAAAGAGLLALIAVIGPLIAALSLAAGAVVALAGSLTFAALGGVAALSAAILPLAAGLGITVAAILSMDKATKKALGESIKPFTTEMKSLGQIAAKGLFADAPRQARELGKAFTGLDTLVRRSSEALSDVVDIFIGGLNSSTFDSFIAAMEDFIPKSIRKLGEVANSTFGGISGLLVAITAPGGLADRFLNYMVDITKQFSVFANSAEGQTKLQDFFERAGNSAASLGNLINATGGLLKTLFNTGGANAGDNIIDSLANSIDRFNAYLKANPKVLGDWFDSAEQFASALGHAAVGFGKLFSAFDESATRDVIVNYFIYAAGMAELFAKAVQFVGETIKATVTVSLTLFASLLDGLGRAGGVLSHLPGIPDDFGDSAHRAATNLRAMRDQMNGQAGDTNEVVVKVDAGQVATAQQKVDTFFTGLAEGLQKTFPVKVDASQVASAQLAISDFRVFVNGVFDPPHYVKISKEDVLKANAAVRAFRDLVEQVFPPTRKVSVNDASIRVAERRVFSLRDAINLLLPAHKIKMDSQAVQDAYSIVNSLKTLLDSLPGHKKIVVTTVRQADKGVATGGVIENGWLERTRKMAAGGFANSAQFRNYQIGEAGREAIVPLDRPLGAVDPSVRALAAFARGIQPPDSGGPRIDASGWTIVTPTEDPKAVAKEALDQLVAAGY